MRAVGIICEYNPMHRGHAYLLEQASGAECVVCVMSGSFTQRGEAAVLPPVTRAEMALRSGADLVLELPFPYACASARYFATAGVRALAGMGCDTLLFGSESADKETLLAAGERLLDDALIAACESRSPEVGDAAAHFAAFGDLPLSNDILAMEYTRAILAEGCDMEIAPVKRVGAAYRDTNAATTYPSATALRKILFEGGDVTEHLPSTAVDTFRSGVERYGLADTARLGPALLALLRSGTLPEDVADARGGLLAHLARAAQHATDYHTLCRAAATKRYTDGRLRRVMLYALCGVQGEDLGAPPAYLRLLGANERGRAYLAKTRKTRTVCVTTKPSDVAALGECAERQSDLSARADALYALCMEKPTLPRTLTLTPPCFL